MSSSARRRWVGVGLISAAVLVWAHHRYVDGPVAVSRQFLEAVLRGHRAAAIAAMEAGPPPIESADRSQLDPPAKLQMLPRSPAPQSRSADVVQLPDGATEKARGVLSAGDSRAAGSSDAGPWESPLNVLPSVSVVRNWAWRWGPRATVSWLVRHQGVTIQPVIELQQNRAGQWRVVGGQIQQSGSLRRTSKEQDQRRADEELAETLELAVEPALSPASTR
jgi:hypothetical protein